MKKAYIILFCLFFGITANAQYLTFKDLLYLKTQKSAKTFLIAKDYISSNLNAPVIEVYFKNEGTDKQEKVEFSLHKNKAYVSYQIADTAYMHLILKQLYRQYKLILKDQSEHETFYRFGNLDINIMVDIYKLPPYCNISVGALN